MLLYAVTVGALLRRLDDAWYRLEQAVCVVLLTAMAIAVFFDAVHRQLSGTGRLEAWCQKLVGDEAAGPVSTALAALLGWLVIYGALRTAKVSEPPRRPTAALIAVAGVAATTGLLKGLLLTFPNGLVWAQPLGMAGMLWVGFLGASMATKEGNHLTLEIMEFVWRGKAKAHVGRIGALAAVAFCLVLGWLCLSQVLLERGEYVDSDGAVGVMAGFGVPRYVVFAVLPVSFVVMALRFLGRALGPTQLEQAPAISPITAPAEGEG